MREVEFESACVCLAPMTYVGEEDGRGAPHLEPRESRALAHGHGHLCASCAGHVAVLLECLRESQERLRRSPWRRFADQQPRAGDVILHCGHLRVVVAHQPGRWFKYSAPVCFQRPDGSLGEAEWLAICEACFVKHDAKTPARGDGTWTGDSPLIEKEDPS